MGITGVLVDAHDRAILELEMVLAHDAAHELGDLDLARGHTGADQPSDLPEGRVLGLVQHRHRLLVARPVLHREMGLEAADQVGAGDHLDAEAAQQLDGAAIDDGDIGNGVVGGILHGHFFGAPQHRFEQGVLLLPRQIDMFGAGKVIAAPGFDTVHQFLRLAGGRNVIVPAPRGKTVGVHAENARGDGVTVVKIIKEPAIEAGVLQGVLNGG